MRNLALTIFLLPTLVFAQKFYIDKKLMVEMIDADQSIIYDVTKTNALFISNDTYIETDFTKVEDPTALLSKLKKCPVHGETRKRLNRMCFIGDSIYQSQLQTIEKYKISKRNNIFVTRNINDIRSITDSLLSQTKREYKFDSVIVNNAKRIVIATYIGNDSTTIDFYFKKVVVGENLNLEIKGADYYIFEKIDGRFLDIFPIWRKSFDSNASQETILNQKWIKPVFFLSDKFKLNYKLYSMEKGYWYIKLDSYSFKEL